MAKLGLLLDVLSGVGGIAVDVTKQAALQSDSALAMADQLQAAADDLDLTAEQLQILRFAALKAGVSHDALDAALAHFVAQLRKAQEGAGELDEILQRYGIALRDAADGSCGYSRDSINSKIRSALSRRLICSDTALA